MKKVKKPRWQFYWSYQYPFQLVPTFKKIPLLWKDKYETPRCEHVPTIEITWLWFFLSWRQGDDEFWEQWLWLYEYNDGNLEEAKDTWGWVDYKTKESTWKNFDEL